MISMQTRTNTMIEFMCTMLCGVLMCVALRSLLSMISAIKIKNNIIEDERIKEEIAIAGEDTS
jgi:hypothetical protein